MSGTTQGHGLGKGIGAAAGAALVGALAWALLTIVTNYQIGFAAVGIGLLVGFVVKASGTTHPAMPILAGVIALVGCLVGDVLTDAKFLSDALNDAGGDVGYFSALKEMVKDPGGLGVEVYKEGFSPISLLFYALAALAAFRTVNEAVAAAPAPSVDPIPPGATA